MTTRELICKCGAHCHARTIEDDSVNATEVADSAYPLEWEGGDPACEHEDFEFGPPEHEEPPDCGYDPGPSLMDQHQAAWQSKFGPGGTHRRN